MSGNFAIKGGGGRPPNGKCHLKFPFWLFDYFPKSVSALCEFCSNRRICQSCYMDFSKLLHGFVKIDTGICLNLYTVFAKLLNGFVKVLCIPRPLPKNKARDKFDQDFKACWSFCFEQKVLNESKYSMPWVCCAFGNNLICILGIFLPNGYNLAHIFQRAG